MAKGERGGGSQKGGGGDSGGGGGNRQRLEHSGITARDSALHGCRDWLAVLFQERQALILWGEGKGTKVGAEGAGRDERNATTNSVRSLGRERKQKGKQKQHYEAINALGRERGRRSTLPY